MSFVKKLSRYFLAGVFTLLPLVITASVAIWLTGFISQYLGPGTALGGLVKSFGLKVSSQKTIAYIVGWVAVLSVIFLFGLIVEMGARKYIQHTVERIMRRIPFIGRVYGTATQLVDIIGKKGEDGLKGMRVVYCSFGGEKGAVFLALMPTPERFVINEIEHQVVLIPTAPVPVGGSLLLVPADSIQPANMPIEDFMSIYLSMGASSSQYISQKV
jgi:uncharacterized membrane protein